MVSAPPEGGEENGACEPEVAAAGCVCAVDRDPGLPGGGGEAGAGGEVGGGGERLVTSPTVVSRTAAVLTPTPGIKVMGWERARTPTVTPAA